MHIYSQWDPWVIGTPPPKKNIHKNTKPLDPVIVGQAWHSCPRPSVSKPQPQLYAEHHWRIPEALPRGLRSCFCSFEGKIEQWCFLRVILRVETISMLSSNETLPHMQCTPEHITWNHQRTHVSCIFLCPCGTCFTSCTHFCQPLLLLCQTEAQTDVRVTMVWSDVIADKA